jgi:beta-ketoacyl-acyl-carrier-protein synthase II
MSTQHRRVAITGIGLVTPVGVGVIETWQSLVDGRSGVAPITLFDASGFPVRIAAEVKGDAYLSLTGHRRVTKAAGRAHLFALAAAEEALRDAGIRPDQAQPHRWGCAVGTGMVSVPYAELEALQQEATRDGELDTDRLLDSWIGSDPIAFCRSQAAQGVSLLAQRYGIEGYTTSVHTACASGGQAVGTGLKLIRRGDCDRVLAGGFDSMISPLGLSGFCLLNAVSADNDSPQQASRPFDATRNGFVLGEGAGFLVLEEWEMARKRGATIYAELAGEGNSLSSYRITDSHPSGDGPIQAMQQALECAGIRPDEVDYLNAHGTSTPMNDRSEAAAAHAVFGDHVANLAVSSTKSTMGHLIAAAGAVEAAVCALAIHHRTIPINANLKQRDPECDLNFVCGQATQKDLRVAMSNSLGFGGSNSCLVFRKAEDDHR